LIDFEYVFRREAVVESQDVKELKELSIIEDTLSSPNGEVFVSVQVVPFEASILDHPVVIVSVKNCHLTIIVCSGN
jgi:hypothetical protein